MTPERRRDYNIRSLLNRQNIIVERSDNIANKQRYLGRVMTAVALLQRVGVIREDGDGLSVFGIPPGGEIYQKLLEQTQMYERMQIREKERVAQFFGAGEPSQELLWRLLSKD